MNKNYLLEEQKLSYHPERVAEFINKNDCYPLYMEISPVGLCSHRCMFCSYDYINYPNRKLETGRMLKFIDEIADCGIKSLLYAGEGEPFLHPDIDQFIVRSKERGIDVGAFSNGQAMTKKMAEKVLPALQFLRFSFNGGSKENYAFIHKVKPAIYDLVLENIANAVAIKRDQKLTVDLGTQFVLLPENIDTLVNIAKVFSEIGVDYFAVKQFVQQSPKQGYQMEKQFVLEDIEPILKEAESYSHENFKVIVRRESLKNYGQRNYEHCYGTSMVSVMNSAGEIASCLPYWDNKDFIFGNIYQNSFKEIWHSEQRKKILEFLQCKLEAKKCPPNCRPNEINKYLWELKNPSLRHLNFI